MKFEVELSNGKKRRFVFKHIGDGKTVCRMDIVDPQNENKWLQFRSALAVCADCDFPNKWLGRKVALSRVLRQMGKEDRWFVWKAYFSAVAAKIMAENFAPAKQTMPDIVEIKKCVKVASKWNEAINPKCRCRKGK